MPVVCLSVRCEDEGAIRNDDLPAYRGSIHHMLVPMYAIEHASVALGGRLVIMARLGVEGGRRGPDAPRLCTCAWMASMYVIET